MLRHSWQCLSLMKFVQRRQRVLTPGSRHVVQDQGERADDDT